MPNATTAERLAAKPTKALLSIVEGVQHAANDTQSYAYRFEVQDDDSVIEIRCAALPRLEGVAPAASEQLEGVLCQSPDELLRCEHVGNGHYGWVPADDRTKSFQTECGAGGHVLVAHPAGTAA